MTSLRLLHSWIRANDPGPIALLDPEAPELVDGKAVTGVRLSGPLAEVPRHEILESLNLGATIIYLHGDTGPLHELTTMLEGIGITRLRHGHPEVKPRQIFSSDDVPHSRRDLFGIAGNMAELPDETLLGEERERLALNLLMEKEGIPVSALADAPSHGLNLQTTGCTACGVCVKACPVDALELSYLEIGPDRRISTLSMFDAACVGCRKCIDLCPEDAFTVRGNTSWETRLGEPVKRPLETIPTVQCEKCKTYFPMSQGGTLCQTCKATRDNPFGIRWPEGVPKPPGFKY
ncbi:4Fe-4S dicluster domain-containing protein [Flaviflexus massiliensis]|uniref:4Fe-4S dicluster domain-containing protein n=1 Tax=Flaviflexus massiliensis TaxID=1522309 RepID=UPI0006D53AC6|nr:4Fe-4S dicluster domain-containing protein [Flaviflexus massiliensis]